MSECDSLSRPTWALGVILRKEALLSLTDFTVSTLLLILLTDLVSPLYSLHFTPPGFTEFTDSTSMFVLHVFHDFRSWLSISSVYSTTFSTLTSL